MQAKSSVERKIKMEEEPAVQPSKSKIPFLRSKVSKPSSSSQQAPTILPKLCLICKNVAKRTKIKGNWVHETLCKAETSDAGKIEIKKHKVKEICVSESFLQLLFATSLKK